MSIRKRIWSVVLAPKTVTSSKLYAGKIVSKMTCNGSSGTLNLTILWNCRSVPTISGRR